MYLSVTILVRGRAFQVEESTDLQLWQPAVPTYNFGDNDAVERIGVAWDVKSAEETRPRFFPVAQ
jgi:hypothetical protein